MIAFVTTCKGRTHHLAQTLPVNLLHNLDNPNAKFIVLDYGSQDNLLEYLQSHYPTLIEAGRLVVYSYRTHAPFHMAHAKNMAHRLGILEGADFLCNLDADNFTGPCFADYLNRMFHPAYTVSAANADDPPAVVWPEVFLWANTLGFGAERSRMRGTNGRIAISARAFIKSGGYDEKYATWSPDDKDFNVRLRRLGYQGIEIDQAFLRVILHNDKMRFKEYTHAMQPASIEDESEAVNDTDTTIVNFGNIGCGTVYRNFDFTQPITLAPIPTRIFGIGMHKTGTTSLHTALQLLGYDSAHWKSAHWAKAIWTEMLACNRSRTLENHYALSDLPIATLFRQLDTAYPGSKFILTMRNEQSWVDSVRNHWSREHNKFRSFWDTDPFTHLIHKEIYGQRNFDADTFLAKYHKHNWDVAYHFAKRPDDLLVMNMDLGAGWPELCKFLGRAVPSMPYPKAFATPIPGKEPVE